MKKVLLDTNAYSSLMLGNERVLDVIAISDMLFMSVFVLGELYAGFKGRTKEKENHSEMMVYAKVVSLKPGVSRYHEKDIGQLPAIKADVTVYLKVTVNNIAYSFN